VTESGVVYVCGSGELGRLGLGHLAPAPTPMEIKYFGAHKLKVSQVSCGIAHTLALTDDRRVYAWGDGTWGNTGIANSPEVTEPTELHSLAVVEVIKVESGGYHSAAITMEGAMYTWGKNTNGQVRLDPKFEKAQVTGRRSQVTGHSKFGSGVLTCFASRETVCACVHIQNLEPTSLNALNPKPHTAYTLKTKNLGPTFLNALNPESIQLGIGTITVCEESPHLVENVGGNYVVDIALGRNHTVITVQSTPPNVFTCGMNANGQVG